MIQRSRERESSRERSSSREIKREFKRERSRERVQESSREREREFKRKIKREREFKRERTDLVESHRVREAADANGVKDSEGSKTRGLCCVLCKFKRNLDVALGGEVVDLVRLCLVEDRHQT